MPFPPPKHRLDDAEQSVFHDLLAEKGGDWKQLARVVGGSEGEQGCRYGVKMLNGKKAFSGPAWLRAKTFCGITDAEFRRRVAKYRQRCLDKLDDPLLVDRVKFFGEYLAIIQSIAERSSCAVIAVDATGAATQFTNWLENPLYRALLQVNRQYVVAYRRRHGTGTVALQRNFILDPQALTEDGIANLKATLQQHLHAGIICGILYKEPQTPTEVVADIADLSDEVCIDAGLIEGFVAEKAKLKDVITKPGDKLFHQIRDRVRWTAEPRNLDLEVYCTDVISELLRDLRKKVIKN